MVTFYRRLPKFEYLAPKTLKETLNLLAEHDPEKAMVYAGGTDVIPKLKSRLIEVPVVLVDLKDIPDLNYIVYDEKSGLRIGALATIRSVAEDSIVKERFSILSQAANSIASTQVQNRGTIAGNICNALPSADSAPALLCLKAKLLCIGQKGERTIKINEFFTGTGKTALNPNELLKEIQIPNMPENSKGVYIKLSRRSKMDLAVLGVAAVVSVENSLFSDVRIGLGCAAPTPIRANKAEEILKKHAISDELIMKAAQRASEESKPRDSHRASAQYRRWMIEVLVKRAINQALSKLGTFAGGT